MPAQPCRGAGQRQRRGRQREQPLPARHHQQQRHRAMAGVLERAQRHHRGRHERQQQRQGDAMGGTGQRQPGTCEIEAGMPACRSWRLGQGPCGHRGDVVHNVT
ncbi:hypothetical protein G6F60_015112 [Rhizopus arrhizus]|nr:hypothetical protein G6F40_016970 [Rhizopus arrhizus]KAG1256085.1 hypothetical protein G6F68_009941 [Rhizopus microsporus]KAG1382679.1 hypothetical protein G6F60_015112 [Rhizopus arrhizus]